MIAPTRLKIISGRFWRSAFAQDQPSLLAPAAAPHGRWHRDGQRALYLSATPEGCRIAIKTYQQMSDPERFIFPMWVENARVADLRDPDSRADLYTSLADIHAFWADHLAKGQTSPT